MRVRHSAFTSVHARGGYRPGTRRAFSHGQNHDFDCAPLSASVPGSPTALEAALQFYSFARIVFRTKG
jgi:hypothetical protein